MSGRALLHLLLAGLLALVAGHGDRQPKPLPLPASLFTGRNGIQQTSRCSGGFSVRKAVDFDGQAPYILRFQEVLTNLGGWSATESDFQAPCTGAYFFTFHAVSTDGGDFTVALMKEGKYQVTAYGSVADYQHGSNSALLFLNAGEKVNLEVQQGILYEHPYDEAYTTFSGFLVEQF